MTLQLVVTEKTRCDAPAIIGLVNALQYFFVIRDDVKSFSLPATMLSQPILHPSDVTRFVRSTIITELESAPSFTVVLTSHSLPLRENHSTFRDGDTSIVSNHLWRAADVPETFRFARHILQLGLSKQLKHTSAVRSCIAGPQEGFDCLCLECEQQLLDLGFRDGVMFLKDSLNTLNQLQSGGSIGATNDDPGSEFGELRLARYYVSEFKTEGVDLRGYCVLVVLHFLSDLIPFVKSLRALGVEYSRIYLVAKPYPYARRDQVAHTLQLLGVNVQRASKHREVSECAETVLRNLLASKAPPGKGIIVIEDGGYFAPLLHKPEFETLLRRCVGVVEQTQKGANDDKKIVNLAIPILSVAESAFKKMYESPEIGRVAVQNISRFTPNTKLSGKHATVFGFGSVGQEIAFHLTNSFNMTVSVVEPKLEALLRARHKRAIVSEAEETFDRLQFRAPSLIVGTTGQNSITREVLSQIKHDTILVSTSSDRVEIDVGALEELASGGERPVVDGKTIYIVGESVSRREITLLAEGYPINFYGSESLPNDTIDPIMTLLLICAVELTLRQDLPKTVDSDAIGTIVEKRKLIEKFLAYA